MKKLLTLALVVLLALSCLAPAALAETYIISNSAVIVPDGYEVTVVGADAINIKRDDGAEVEISAISLPMIGIPAGMFSEEELLVGLGLETMNIYPMKGEMVSIGGRKCIIGEGIVNNEGGTVYLAQAMLFQCDDMVLITAGSLKDECRAWVEESVEWIVPASEVQDAITVSNNPSIAVQMEDGTWALPDYGVHIALTEDDCNILTTDTPEDSKSFQRIGISKEILDFMFVSGEDDMFFVPLGGDLMEMVVELRVGDGDQYNGITLRDLPADERENQMKMLARVTPSGEYEVFETENGLYCVFDWTLSGDGDRIYTTIHKGVLYEFDVVRSDAPLTDADIAFLEMVINAVEYA